MLPSLSLASALTVTGAYSLTLVPAAGAVSCTCGGMFGFTVMVTGDEVVDAPRLSVATAVRWNVPIGAWCHTAAYGASLAAPI